MPLRSAHDAPAALIGVLLGALASVLFFQGLGLQFLAISLALQMGALVLLLWQRDGRLVLPGSALTASLTLYWLWLALTLFWTPVPATSIINFWWLGSLPFVFWITVLLPPEGRAWTLLFRGVVAIDLALAVWAFIQFFALHAVPDSVFLYANPQNALFDLAILPLLGLVLAALRQGATRRALGLSAVALVLVGTVALTEERGPAIALGIGLVWLTWATRSVTSARARAIPWVIVVGTYLLVNVAVLGQPFGRLATFAHPATAAITRVAIWQGAWALFVHTPWHGLGLGLFSLAYPPYRRFSDTSAGFYVHDDYLQLAIEAGIVGLVLLAAVLVAVVRRYRQGQRQRAATPDARIELAALFAALLATAAHALVDFVFYVPAILIVCAFWLARLHHLSAAPGAGGIKLSLRGPMSREGFRIILVLLALSPLAYFSALALSGYQYRQALQAAAHGDWVASERAFEYARRLFPGSDTLDTSEADLYRQLLRFLPPGDTGQRALLYRRAHDLLGSASRLNPLRPDPWWLRGELDSEQPQLAGPKARARALADYQQALALDPRFFVARFDAGELLLHRHQTAAARALLDAGIRYWYPPSPQVLPYYGLTAGLARAAGDHPQAALIEARMRLIEQAFPANALVKKVMTLDEVPRGRGWDAP